MELINFPFKGYVGIESITDLILTIRKSVINRNQF